MAPRRPRSTSTTVRSNGQKSVGSLPTATPSSSPPTPPPLAPLPPASPLLKSAVAAAAVVCSGGDGSVVAGGDEDSKLVPLICPLDHSDAVKCLKGAYGRIANGFGTDFASGFGVHSVDSANMQYGEITYDGMQALYPSLGLRPNDVFYDLGSGLGKLVLYVALRGTVSKAVGLEIGCRRHRLAQTAAELLSTPKNCAEFELLQEDISRRPYKDASVVVITNLCMDMGVQGRTIDSLMRCESLRRIVCICPLPPKPQLKLLKTVKVACTWAKVSSWQIYEVVRDVSGGLDQTRASRLRSLSRSTLRTRPCSMTRLLPIIGGGKRGQQSQQQQQPQQQQQQQQQKQLPAYQPSDTE